MRSASAIAFLLVLSVTNPVLADCWRNNQREGEGSTAEFPGVGIQKCVGGEWKALFRPVSDSGRISFTAAGANGQLVAMNFRRATQTGEETAAEPNAVRSPGTALDYEMCVCATGQHLLDSGNGATWKRGRCQLPTINLGTITEANIEVSQASCVRGQPQQTHAGPYEVCYSQKLVTTLCEATWTITGKLTLP